MSRHAVNELVAGAAGLIGLVLYVTFILRPAWVSYTRVWERIAASVLSLYVLGVMVGVGVGVGLGVALAADHFWG